MTSRARFATVVALLLVAFVGYRIWDSPERRIQRLLDEVASALSHDEPVTGLAAVTFATSLQPHLAPEITIDAGRPVGVLKGAQEVVASAARLRLATPMLRVEFLDVQIDVTGGTAASVHATVKVTARGQSGQENMDAREISGSLALRDGRWLLTAVKTVPVLEPVL